MLREYVPPVAVDSVSLSDSSLSLYVGQTATLVATVLPSNATNRAVIWESDDASVATVDNNGHVTATGTGTCDVVCVSEDNISAQDDCHVTVRAYIPVEDIKLYDQNDNELSAQVTTSSNLFYFRVEVLPQDASNKEVLVTEAFGRDVISQTGETTYCVNCSSGGNFFIEVEAVDRPDLGTVGFEIIKN